VTCYPASGGPGAARQARVRNLSRSGVGLVVDRHWEPGTTLSIGLPLGPEGAALLRPARVIHATALPGGRFLIGCSLDTPLTDAEMQALTTAAS
jgi:hypothetical protein